MILYSAVFFDTKIEIWSRNLHTQYALYFKLQQTKITNLAHTENGYHKTTRTVKFSEQVS